MLPETVLQQAANETGWDENSMLQVTLGFISEAKMTTAFERYVKERVEDEKEAHRQMVGDEDS